MTPALGPRELREIADHAAGAYPREACGLILLNQGRFQIIHCENLADILHGEDPRTYPRTARTSFVMDPVPVWKAHREGTLKGVYHSHCDASDHFSAEDRHLATMGLGEAAGPAWEGCEYLVVSVMRGRSVRATMWSYCVESSRFEATEVYESL